MEYQSYPLCELKFAEIGGAMTFEGYGAVFNNVDFGGDLIEPGAFIKTLDEHKVNATRPAMYYQHGRRGGGPTIPVGVWTSMVEDDHGLKVSGKLSDTALGRDLHVLMKDEAIKGLSIGYRVTDSTPRLRPEDPKRRIKSASLVEVSLVEDPMNPLAGVTQVKSAEEIITIRELEDTLRDAGYSKSDALAICARFQAKTDRGEPETDEAFESAAQELLKSLKL